MVSKSSLLFNLILIYVILLVYASLMPFDFSLNVYLSRDISSFWNHWPLKPENRFSGSDVISNLVLYFPLSWLISVKLRLKNNNFFISALFALTACSCLSLCIEILQIFSIKRTASGGDWLINSFSAFCGGISGGCCGKKIWGSFTGFLNGKNHNTPLITAGLLFVLLTAADSLSPFMPTIMIKDVWQSFQNSHFNLFQGFMLHSFYWWILRSLTWFFLTLICIHIFKKKRSFFSVGFFVFLFLLFLEISKFFIISRFFNTANIVTGFAGIAAGLLSGKKVLSFKNNTKLNLCIIFLILYILKNQLYPFNFTIDTEIVKKKIPGLINWIPLYDYAMGSTLEHARLFFQNISLQAALVYLIIIRYRIFSASFSGIATAGLFSAFFGIFLESFQFFLPSRIPSPTDLYCFASGGALGAWLRYKTLN
jgi:VanZ family protein